MLFSKGKSPMPDPIEGLKPELVWKYFAEISRIPRCSKKEAAVARYVLDTARRLGLEAEIDKLGNVVARKPASSGRQNVRSVALQGHLDMVCEKNKDKVHNFLKDPIEIVRSGNVLSANGTTLGADNGIAVAASLAIMEDRSLEHGPLEFLFTVDEETGLTGAGNLSSDFLESRTLLNLDSEEEGALYVGCSGGKDTLGTWAIHSEEVRGAVKPVQVRVSGLRGGHSGLEIDRGRANAIKIMGRVLTALSQAGARLSFIAGGNKHNAIPRECESLLLIPAQKMDAAEKVVNDLNRTVKSEFATAEPGLLISLTVQKTRKNPSALRKSEQRKILQTISALPHGIIKMSADIPGLVETSTNLAVIRTIRNSVTIATSQRSSVSSELDEIADSVSSVFELGGASVENTDAYPGWKPNMDSSILNMAKSAYRELFGKEPEVKAIHAGLECGIIGERIPGMDMVSLGPTLEDVHSPDEKIYIDTVERFWNFLLEILKKVD
jgi:dipeptidase D